MFNKKSKKFELKTKQIASPSPLDEYINSFQEEVKPEKGNALNELKDVVHFILVVLFVGFAALLVTVIFSLGGWYVSSMAQKQATLEDLKDQVLLQNTKIDTLTAELQNNKIIKK